MTRMLKLQVVAAGHAKELWHRFKTDERGEGMISFLIIAVGVAVAALAVWAFINNMIVDKSKQLDFGDAPTTTITTP